MRKLLRGSLEDGAFAMSSGLIYPPGCYADTEELIELCKELVPYGAFYATHMRGEGEGVVESVKEAIAICERSGAPLEISHHKVIKKSVWQVHCKTTIALIDQARRRGLDLILENFNPKGTMLIVTHLIHDIERLFDDVIVLKEGRVETFTASDSLRAQYGGSLEEALKAMFREEAAR